MLSTQARTFPYSDALARIAGIGLFAVLTGLAARVVIPLAPVPVTLQVLAVLLAGLVLGPRDGALSQLAYLAAITAGAPLDARMLGPAVWLQPTAGYLLGFVAGAWLTGKVWELLRGRMRGAALAGGLAGILGIYLPGALWLTLVFLNGDAGKGFALGVAPFLIADLLKAGVAASLAETGIAGLRRMGWTQ